MRSTQKEVKNSNYNLRLRPQKTVSAENTKNAMKKNLKMPIPKHQYHENNIDDAVQHTANSANEESNSSSTHKLFLFIVIMLILVFTTGIWYFKFPVEQNFVNVNIEQFSTDILSLDKDFVNQSSNLWLNIISGMKDYHMKKPQQPFVIMLYDNVNSKSDTAECLAQILATKIIIFINGRETARPEIREASTLQRDEFGDLMEELKSILMSTKVLVINNLQVIIRYFIFFNS
jgi:hypothetical protein